MSKKARRPQSSKSGKKKKGSPFPKKKTVGRPKWEDDEWELQRDQYLNRNT